MKQLNSKYDFAKVEEGKYETWLKEERFKAEGKKSNKDPFSIMIPPPNVTGILHLGHAWDGTIQDILVRYKRMNNFDTLYLPGMDHAGIATQAVVDARLKSEGISRYEIGREKFNERAFEWKDDYAARIKSQWESLGLSLDYSRERFTLDDDFSEAVNTLFIKLYEDGLLYRGERIINWDVEAKTALSNIEVEHKDIMGHMYTFKYMFEDSEKYLEIATTRPETMFGDVCIVVNPDDERYTDVIGKKVINPANGDILPIIADEYVDVEFGTGAMKCTPAHDPNDFEIGERHNLEMINCMNEDGSMNENAGQFAGLDRFEARKQLVEFIKEKDCVVEIKEYMHQVGHSERTGVIVEPYLSKQWFVKMKPLAQEVLKYQKDEDTKINFYPQRFENVLYNWLENIEDWCISRQIWWGHKIPAYYHKETNEIYVGKTAPKDIENYRQDTDVLDTWFSSALWPFATLGWPKETDDLERYFPNDTLVTGYDIVFFWVARMGFTSRYLMKSRPFKDVVIHGLIRDSEGRKMSKSLGNGVDPKDVIATYGIDALRFFLATNSTPGQDVRYIENKVEAAWNFINKLWNASRFTIMNLEDLEITKPSKEDLSLADFWINERFNKTLKSITENLEKYEYALAGNELYHFVWDEFCDWYIELSKASLKSDDQKLKNAAAYTLKTTLNNILKLLHPFIPFVTDEIYSNINSQSIYQTSWPKSSSFTNKAKVEKMEQVITIIKLFREVRVDYNLKPSLELEFTIVDHDKNQIEFNSLEKEILSLIAKVKVVSTIEGEALVKPFKGGSVSLLLSDVVDFEEELDKLEKEKNRLKNEVVRSNKMLANKGFINKAPQAKVQAEKDKLEAYQTQLETVLERISETKNKMEE